MLAFSNDYYGMIFRATQSVELFCAYEKLIMLHEKLDVDLTYVLTGNINSTLIFDKILEECPPDKRYDLSQLLKYALNLTK